MYTYNLVMDIFGKHYLVAMSGAGLGVTMTEDTRINMTQFLPLEVAA